MLLDVRPIRVRAATQERNTHTDQRRDPEAEKRLADALTQASGCGRSNAAPSMRMTRLEVKVGKIYRRPPLVPSAAARNTPDRDEIVQSGAWTTSTTATAPPTRCVRRSATVTDQVPAS